MTKDAVNQYDSTAANNTDVGGVNLGEGTGAGAMYPSDVNNAFREIMSHLKDVDAGTSSMTSPDINGGTIDGATIGSSSPAAGTFTTFTSTGIDDNASSTAITIDSSQNVGIGTTPSRKLEVLKSGVDDVNVAVIGGGSGAGGASVAIGASGTSSYIRGVNNGVGAYTPLNLGGSYTAFEVSASEKMRITSGGNVAIGQTSATRKLEVNAAAVGAIATLTDGVATNFTFKTDGSSVGTFGTEAGSTQLAFMVANSEKMRLTSSGVGINTTPSYRLHISNGSSTGTAMQLETTGSGHNFDMVDGTGTARFRNVNGEMRLYGDLNSGGNGNIVFAPQGTTERARLDSSGRLGLGTSAPDTKLHVVDTTTGGQFIVASTETDAVNKVGSFATQHYTNAEEPVLGMAIQSTSSDNKVFIGGVFSQFNAATEIRFYTAANNTTTGGSERMRIDSVGNFGIGTSSPSYLFTVENSSTDADYYAGRLYSVANPSGTSKTHLRLEKGNGYGGTIAGYLEQGVGSGLSFQTINGGTVTEQVRITNSGNVGISNTAPAEKLDVAGSIRNTPDNSSYMYVGRYSSGYGGSVLNTSGGSTFLSTQIEGSEKMRIDSSGNVGIGTSSPSTPLHVVGTVSIENSSGFAALEMGGSSGAFIDLKNPFSDDYDARLWTDGTDVFLSNKSATGSLDLKTNDTQRLRIDSSGDLRVGQATTSTPGFNNTTVGGAWSQNGSSLHLSRNSNAVAWFSRNSTTGTIQSFRYNGSAVGSISVTASATAYNTSSDYRLKENVVGLSGAIDRVKLLKPSRFNFTADPDTTVDGFVAHEVSGVVPEAVHGEKDAVDEDGNPEYQGIDQSKLVPLLTAALQEAVNKIETLEARVAALEGV